MICRSYLLDKFFDNNQNIITLWHTINIKQINVNVYKYK